MTRSDDHDKHDLHASNGTRDDGNKDNAEISTAETKRLAARRRFLKGGIGGTAALVLSVYHRPTRATYMWDYSKGDTKDNSNDYTYKDKNKQMSVMCEMKDYSKKKVGHSVCMSITNQAKDGYYVKYNDYNSQKKWWWK